ASSWSRGSPSRAPASSIRARRHRCRSRSWRGERPTAARSSSWRGRAAWSRTCCALRPRPRPSTARSRCGTCDRAAATSCPAGGRASAAARRRDPSAAVAARLGRGEANPLFDGAPALGFAMRPGAEVDTRLYSERRALGVRPSSEGLSLLRLHAEDVAHARPDLADVRVVDAAARQWPYLLEPDAAQEWQPLEIASPLRRERASRYRLGLPVSLVRLDQIVLDNDTPFFDRAFR